MKRRVLVDAERDDVPRRLLRFVYADWADESVSPPWWWAEGGRTWSVQEWYGIRAFKRFAAARREWRSAHGVSRREWDELLATHGVGVVVDPAPPRRV